MNIEDALYIQWIPVLPSPSIYKKKGLRFKTKTDIILADGLQRKDKFTKTKRM